MIKPKRMPMSRYREVSVVNASMKNLLMSWIVTCAGLMFCPLAANGDMIFTSRLSEVSYDTFDLTNGIPPSPPTSFSISTTHLTAPFDESLSQTFNYFSVIGAQNTGQLLIQQNTSISQTVISSEVSQFAKTTTDIGSPLINTKSLFRLGFEVDQPTPIVLTGTVDGSGIVGAANFARVMLSRDSGNVFNTAFGHLFPFYHTVEPGYEYVLEIEVKGSSVFNNFTDSYALVTLAAVPEPTSLLLCSLALVFLVPRGVRRMSAFLTAPTCQPMETSVSL